MQGEWSHELLILNDEPNIVSKVTAIFPYIQKVKRCDYRNIEVRSCSHCCSGKAITISYSECVFVALGIQHANACAPHYIVICGLSVSTFFFHIIS